MEIQAGTLRRSPSGTACCNRFRRNQSTAVFLARRGRRSWRTPAQLFQVGSYLVPNNLSAHAHGNGYADPNFIIPATIESVETDGGALG